MDNRAILRLLGDILKNLDKVEKKIVADSWAETDELFSAIRGAEKKLSSAGKDIPARITADPVFAARYTDLKDQVSARITDVARSIESWKLTQLKKIAAARNVTNSLNRYFKTPDTSFYVDKKE